MELRLFPLHTVLFPGMPLPLNVFEPRYLQLVQECVEQEEPFGVALIREGPEVGGFADPFLVGATARIEQVAQGMLNTIQLMARGERRVRILELHHDRPYLWADAEEIDDQPDEAGEAPQELLERGQELLDEFERLRFSSQGGYVRPRSPNPRHEAARRARRRDRGDRRGPSRRAAGAARTPRPRRPAGARRGDVRPADRADAAALGGQRAAPLGANPARSTDPPRRAPPGSPFPSFRRKPESSPSEVPSCHRRPRGREGLRRAPSPPPSPPGEGAGSAQRNERRRGNGSV